jgi:CDGSH-type Zn-finger protein/uncharacterized Fe-S cluster protein YjdI
MDDDIHQYAGEEIEVSYDVQRCTHARECVKRLPAVFDPDERPWIDPDGADVDDLRGVIMQCPTGALQFERRDGGPSEPVPEANTVTVVPDGPLHLRGDIEITDPDGEVVLEDTRVALCRCGASQNKPLCDDSHADVDFRADGRIGDDRSQVDDDPGIAVLRVRTRPDGPVTLEGEFEIRGTDPGSSVHGTETALCRCGGSEDKPFCDGSHVEGGFSPDDSRGS